MVPSRRSLRAVDGPITLFAIWRCTRSGIFIVLSNVDIIFKVYDNLGLCAITTGARASRRRTQLRVLHPYKVCHTRRYLVETIEPKAFESLFQERCSSRL